MIYYIYEVPTEKNGATKDWEERRAYNFNEYQIEPIIVETMEGPDTEEYWQVVGDREWYYADLNGYSRGTHYVEMMLMSIKGGSARAQQESFKNINDYVSNESRSKGGSIGGVRTRDLGHLDKARTFKSCSKGGINMRGHRYNKVTCPHCNKEGGGGNMKRFHFDNCKLA